MESKRDKNNTFYCPYCGHYKDIAEMDYNTEIGGFQPYWGKIDRPVSHNIHIWQYEKRQVPICTDCVLKIQEAKEKATWIAFGLFVPIAAVILYYTLKTDGGFWDILIPISLLAAVCYIIRWVTKKMLIAKKGLSTEKHYSYTGVDLISEVLEGIREHEIEQKEREEKELKEFEELKESIEEWNKTNRTVGITPTRECYLDDDTNEQTVSESDFPDIPGYVKEVKDGTVYYNLDL